MSALPNASVRTRIFFSIITSLLIGVCASAQGSFAGKFGGKQLAHPPRLTATLAPESVFLPGDTVRFRVRVTDDDLGTASLFLRKAPPGLVLEVARKAVPPFEREVVWHVPAHSGGLRTIEIEAVDDTLKRSRLVIPVHVLGETVRTSVVVGDVTGDGKDDVVGGASTADEGGVGNSGGIYVWSGADIESGSAAGPLATLLAEEAQQGDSLGQIGSPAPGEQALQLADVTGDGILDVIGVATQADVDGVKDVGAVYVWEGGATLSGRRTSATRLRLFNAQPFDRLGEIAGQGLLLADVTGDGVRDILVGASLADLGGTNRGALYLWTGGPGLTGKIGPDATLSVPTGQDFDNLGGHTRQGVYLAEVSGDGILDVLVPAPSATFNGAVNVWLGGSGLSGSVAPDATLTDASTLLIGSRTLAFADVTDDGIQDVVVMGFDRGLVFAGGAGMLGTPGAAAILTPFLGTPGLASGRGVGLEDVSGDGIPDITIIASDAAVAGFSDVGAIFLWLGGSTLTGTVAADAYLFVDEAAMGDRLGVVESTLGSGLLFDDVTGDGILDVLAGASNADVAGVVDNGAIYVWHGGAGLVGGRVANAVLHVASATGGDALGAGEGGTRILFGDVDGDGVNDVVAAAPQADLGSVVDAGAVYAWRGGSTLLQGFPAPFATLVRSSPAALDRLSECEGQGLFLVDLTGDGRLDVVAASVAAAAARGVVTVFRGGAGLAGTPLPLAELSASDAQPSDRLGDGSGEGLVLIDRDRDGFLDVLACSQNVQGGAIYAFAGGSNLSGSVSETLALRAIDSDRLTDASGNGVHLAEVSGDGAVDLVVGAQFADVDGVRDTGAIYVWSDSSAVSPSCRLSVENAQINDRLGQ